MVTEKYRKEARAGTSQSRRKTCSFRAVKEESKLGKGQRKKLAFQGAKAKRKRNKKLFFPRGLAKGFGAFWEGSRAGPPFCSLPFFGKSNQVNMVYLQRTILYDFCDAQSFLVRII
jgi:hypothetical protein